METAASIADYDVAVAQLLSQVRSLLSAAGCADRINAERWLMTWLDTPNDGFGGARPSSLIKHSEGTSRTIAPN